METFKDIVIYKDFDFKTCYPKTYNLEVVKNKARVINNNPVFGEKSQSRLNKLTPLGGIGNDMRVYSLSVNGKNIFVKIAYKIA
jgi:hypothetical protein